MHFITASNFFTIRTLEIVVPLTKAEVISENQFRTFLYISVFEYFLFLLLFDKNVEIKILDNVMMLFEIFMKFCEKTSVENNQFQSSFL